MRRLLARDLNLLFPLAILFVLGCLAVVGWHRSAAVQSVREASIVNSDEALLLQSLADRLREAEQFQRDYMVSGLKQDLGAFRNAAQRLTALSARIDNRTNDDPELAGDLAGLTRMVDRRQQILVAQADQRGNAAASRPAVGQQDDRVVFDRIDKTLRRLQASRLHTRRIVAGGIRSLRWLTTGLAVLGVVGVLGVLRQLSRAWRRLARAETEQRLLALQLRGSLDSLSQGVAVFSADGLLLNWNMRLSQMLGLPPALLRIGLSYDALEAHLAEGYDLFLEPLGTIRIHASKLGEMYPVVYERVVRRRADADASPDALIPDGQSRDLPSRGLPNRGLPNRGLPNRGLEDGETQIEIRRTLMPQGGFVLTLTDMTERVQGEQILREAQKMQALGQLTGGIAHDFNNMLTVILGSLDVSAAEIASAGDRQIDLLTTRMQQAARAAESGATLTRQLLNFARKQPLAPAPLDLAVVLPNLLPLLRHSSSDNVELSFHATAALWPAIVDGAALESAVLNLAINARDAMPSGGRLVITASNFVLEQGSASLNADLAPGDYVRISVADSGHGMSRDVVARAFEPFFTTKPDGSGTGLGLAMVFAFARQCGGLATIQSEPGRGTTISMYLPRALDAAPALAALPQQEPEMPPPTQDAAAIARGGSRRPRVLLVEDDAAVRGIAAEVLRDLGYRVREAADAEQALRLLEDQSAGLDLLLTDITLPGGIDGRGLAARVRLRAPATPVLYISGHLEAPQSTDASEQTTGWLGKPFRRAQLRDAVGALISQTRSGQAA